MLCGQHGLDARSTTVHVSPMRTLKVSQDDLHARIIESVRSGRANSRGRLAKLHAVAPSTMGLYVEQLLASGILRESGLVKGQAGRPKVNLEVVKGIGWFAGVEFTGARIQVVAVDFAGRPMHGETHALAPGIGVKTVIYELKSALDGLAAKVPGKLLGVGAGAPGLVNPEAGIASYSVSFTDWRDVPLRRLLKEALKVPAAVENNLRTVALAERWFGGGRETPDYVILGPRSGFALAIVKDGALMRGTHQAAGEIGLWPWPAGDAPTQIHELLSAPAIWRRLTGSPAGTPAPANLHLALEGLTGTRSEAWEAVTEDFARVIGMTQLLIDARLYFLHGPLTALGCRFCDEITLKLKTLFPALKDMPLEIRPSQLGDDAGALGAACMAMEAWNPGLS